MNLEQRTRQRIANDFPGVEQSVVAEMLSAYSGPESDRVVWDILRLGEGDLEKVRYYFNAAQTDYRDVLYWAEYYESDPMLRGRDPQEMVDEIISKWGEKK